MQVKLRVVGSNALFEKVSRQFDMSNPLLRRLTEKEDIEWQVVYASERLAPEDFLCFPDMPNVILIDARKRDLIRKIEVMRSQVYATARSNGDIPLVFAPVAVVFDTASTPDSVVDIPDFVSDWLYSDAGPTEWMYRILFCLRKQKIVKRQLRFGSLTLMPELHSVSYEKNTIRLSPSEYALADFFFGKLGTTIRSEELAAFFSAHGKSTDANNIRVAIYQLRLKLEKLTRSQLRIESIYKQGYCLRHSHSERRASAFDAPLSPALRSGTTTALSLESA